MNKEQIKELETSLKNLDTNTLKKLVNFCNEVFTIDHIKIAHLANVELNNRPKRVSWSTTTNKKYRKNINDKSYKQNYPTTVHYRLWFNLTKLKNNNPICCTEDEWINLWKESKQWKNHRKFGGNIRLHRIDKTIPDFTLTNLEIRGPKCGHSKR